MITVMLTLTYAVQMLVDHDILSGGGLHVPLHRLALSPFESKKNEKSVFQPTKTKNVILSSTTVFLRFSFITTQSPRSPVKHDKQPPPSPPLLCTDHRKTPDEKAPSSLDKSAFLGIGTGRQGSGRGQPCSGAVGEELIIKHFRYRAVAAACQARVRLFGIKVCNLVLCNDIQWLWM